MIKTLLIGASALAFASAAQAQVTDLTIDGTSATAGAGFHDAVRAANNPPVSGASDASEAVDAKAAMPSAGSVITPVVASVVAQDALLNPTRNTNKAGIEQDGTDNDAEVNQDSGRAGWGVVNQNGRNNDAIISQTDTGTGGTANGAYVSQASPNGSFLNPGQIARITQVHTGGGLSGQNAVILQGSDSNRATANLGTITQRGGSNGNNPATLQDALIVQTGSINASAISQDGTNNRATTVQAQSGGSTIAQNGNGNGAYVSQGTGQFDVKLSAITQNGNGNFAAVEQKLLAASQIEQTGNNNQAFVEQNAATGLASSAIEQRGAGGNNYASVLQLVGANSEILQTGNGGGNEAYVYQHTAAGSQSVISQNGGGNYAVTRQ